MRHLTLLVLTALLAAPARSSGSAPLASPEACGPWDGTNGRVTAAIKDGLLETLHAYERVLPTRPPDAAARWRDLARLSEDMAMWSVALWATAGREALPETPTSELMRCASNTSSQETGGHPRATCAEAAAFRGDLHEVGRDARTLFEGGRMIRDGRLLPPAPSPGLLGLARRHLGCSASPQAVPRVPRQLVTRQEVQQTLKIRVARDELHARMAARRREREAAAAAAARAEAQAASAKAGASERKIAEVGAASARPVAATRPAPPPKARVATPSDPNAYLRTAWSPSIRTAHAAVKARIDQISASVGSHYSMRTYFYGTDAQRDGYEKNNGVLSRLIRGGKSHADIARDQVGMGLPLTDAVLITEAVQTGVGLRGFPASILRAAYEFVPRETVAAAVDKTLGRPPPSAAPPKPRQASTSWSPSYTSVRPVTGNSESRASDARMKQRQYEIDLDRRIYGTRR